MYEERFYRHYAPGAHTFEVNYKESDLYIVSERPLDKEAVREIVRKQYTLVASYSRTHQEFKNTLSPCRCDDDAPDIIRDMCRVSRIAGVGPFASVAGAVAFYTGTRLLENAGELLIENGGDVFMMTHRPRRIGVYPGGRFKESILILKITSRSHPFGVCSSSASIGHSLNFGNADLVTVISSDVILADALATAYANRIKTISDAQKVIHSARTQGTVEAVAVAIDGKLFLWGDIEIDST